MILANIIQSGLIALIATNTQIVREPIILDKDGSVYQNKIIVVADGANCPAIIIGNRQQRHADITVKNVLIFGNKDKQSTEFYKYDGEGYRNNGIVIANMENAQIENTAVFGARSGGFVSEYNCVSIKLLRCLSAFNYFDGFAGYGTLHSKYNYCLSLLNNYAGYSFDLAWNNNTIRNSLSLFDRREAIFIRASHHNCIWLNYLHPQNNGLLEGENFEVTELLGSAMGMASKNSFVGYNLWTGQPLKAANLTQK